MEKDTVLAQVILKKTPKPTENKLALIVLEALRVAVSRLQLTPTTDTVTAKEKHEL